MKSLADIISPILRESGLEEGVRFNLLKKKWDGLFQEPLRLHLYPASLKEGELIVNVDSPIWLQEVTLQRENFLKALKPFGLKGIKFRLGRVSQTKKASRSVHEKGKRSKKLPQETLRFIDETIDQLKDIELKEIIRAAMEKSLSHEGPSENSMGGF